MDFSLASGHPEYGAAAGAFEELEVLPLAEAVLFPFPLAALFVHPGQIRGVFQLTARQLPGEGPHKAQNNQQQPQPAQQRGQHPVEQGDRQPRQQQPRQPSPEHVLGKLVHALPADEQIVEPITDITHTKHPFC